MKIFSRIIILNFIACFTVATFFPFSYSKTSKEMQTSDVVLFVWVALSILGTFCWVAYVFYHWGTNQFKSNTIKRIWFWVILIGAMLSLIGPIVYHIVVIELGKGGEVSGRRC